MLPDGKVYFTCAIVGETLSINSANSYNNNLWHNFIVTFGNSTSNLFVDGSLVGSKTGGSNKLSYALGAIAIGRDGDNNGWFFNGILDDIGIWNRALSQQEITDIFNSK